jgi:hypothetical protein
MTDTPDEGDLVGLEAHPGPSPVAQAAAGQFLGDVGGLDGQPRRQTLDGDDQGSTVGLAGSQEAQHTATLLDRCRAP